MAAGSPEPVVLPATAGRQGCAAYYPAIPYGYWWMEQEGEKLCQKPQELDMDMELPYFTV